MVAEAWSPLRPIDPTEHAFDIGAHIREIADRHWRLKSLNPTTLVPMLEAAHCFRDQRRKDEGAGAEAAALKRFWDLFAESLLNGEFDDDAKIYVLDIPGIFGTRRRAESEYGYRITSDHMRELTGDAYSYDDVVQRCLARSWCCLRTAASWCERQSLPLPIRWQPGVTRRNGREEPREPVQVKSFSSPTEKAKAEIRRQPAKRGPIDRSKDLVLEIKRRKPLRPNNTLDEVINEVLAEEAEKDPSAKLTTAKTLRRGTACSRPCGPC